MKTTAIINPEFEIKNIHFLRNNLEKLHKYASQVLTSIKRYHFINKTNEALLSPFRINTSIYHKAIDHVLRLEPFNDEDLKEFFNTQKEVEKYIISTLNNEADEEIFFDYEIDFIILGIDYAKFLAFSSKKKNEGDYDNDMLFEEYGYLSFDMRYGRISVEDFITAAKKLLKDKGLM